MILRSMFFAAMTPAVSLGLELSILIRSATEEKITLVYRERKECVVDSSQITFIFGFVRMDGMLFSNRCHSKP